MTTPHESAERAAAKARLDARSAERAKHAKPATVTVARSELDRLYDVETSARNAVRAFEALRVALAIEATP